MRIASLEYGSTGSSGSIGSTAVALSQCGRDELLVLGTEGRSAPCHRTQHLGSVPIKLRPIVMLMYADRGRLARAEA